MRRSMASCRRVMSAAFLGHQPGRWWRAASSAGLPVMRASMAFGCGAQSWRDRTGPSVLRQRPSGSAPLIAPMGQGKPVAPRRPLSPLVLPKTGATLASAALNTLQIEYDRVGQPPGAPGIRPHVIGGAAALAGGVTGIADSDRRPPGRIPARWREGEEQRRSSPAATNSSS